MPNFRIAAIVGVAALAAGIAFAAEPAPAPAPVPAVMPFDIPYGTPITLDKARKAADAAVAEAKKRNWKMAIAIVAPSGDLVHFDFMDGTQYASVAIAQSKALTAAKFRRTTKTFFDNINGGQPSAISMLAIVGGASSEGGFPIVEGGKLIGAIGVSGGMSTQDGVIAQAGLDAIK